MLKDGKEGEYEKEGYGKRLYTNWTKVMFSTEGEVSTHARVVRGCLACVSLAVIALPCSCRTG